MNANIYGPCTDEYSKLERWYKVYETLGGYPAVVSEYNQTQDIEKCKLTVNDIVKIFSEESTRYFERITQIGSIEGLLGNIAILMLKEKTGDLLRIWRSYPLIQEYSAEK